MKHLETDRLHLRPFTWADYPLILAISSDPDTVKYLYYWGRPGMTPEQDAQRFLRYAIGAYEKTPVKSMEYALVRKADGRPIGDGSIERLDDGFSAEIGWILLSQYRGQGYATEMARELLRYGFEELGAERIIAHCDAKNAPSYRVMERLGMRREGVAKQVRPAKITGGRRGDECTYAILKEEWKTQKKLQEVLAFPWHFRDFMTLPELTDGEIRLICAKKRPQDGIDPTVSSYFFLIAKGGETIGSIDLRIGYTPLLFYAGNIGYDILESQRGHGYAGRACQLLWPVLRHHGMRCALITNDADNASSRRVCEKLGARLLCQADVPETMPMYHHGLHRANIFVMGEETAECRSSWKKADGD